MGPLGGIKTRTVPLENTSFIRKGAMIECCECINFMEYTDTYKQQVEKADGDCYIRKVYSDDNQFCAVTRDDFCSLAKPLK